MEKAESAVEGTKTVMMPMTLLGLGIALFSLIFGQLVAPPEKIYAEVSPMSTVRFNNYDSALQYAISFYSISLISDISNMTSNTSGSFNVSSFGSALPGEPGTYVFYPLGEGTVNFSNPQLGTVLVNVTVNPVTFGVFLDDKGFDKRTIVMDPKSTVCFDSNSARTVKVIKSDGAFVKELEVVPTGQLPNASVACSPTYGCLKKAAAAGIECSGTVTKDSPNCYYQVVDAKVGCYNVTGTTCRAKEAPVNYSRDLVCGYDAATNTCTFKAKDAAAPSVCGGGCVPKQPEVGEKITCSKTAQGTCAFSYKDPSGVGRTKTSDIFCTVLLTPDRTFCQPTGIYPDIGCTDSNEATMECSGTPYCSELKVKAGTTRDAYCYYTPSPLYATETGILYIRYSDNRFCDVTLWDESVKYGGETAVLYNTVSSCVLKDGGSILANSTSKCVLVATNITYAECTWDKENKKCRYSSQPASYPFNCSNPQTCPCTLCSSTYPNAGNIQCTPYTDGCMMTSQFAFDTVAAGGPYCNKTIGTVCVSNMSYSGVICGGPDDSGNCQLSSLPVEDFESRFCDKIAGGCEPTYEGVVCSYDISTNKCKVESVAPTCWSPEQGEYRLQDGKTGKVLTVYGYDKRTELIINLKRSFVRITAAVGRFDSASEKAEKGIAVAFLAMLTIGIAFRKKKLG